MIGEANSGKTSLLLRFIDNKFEKQETTIAVDFRIKNLMVDNKIYKM
jgi:GTPase SAR1 family protein